MNPHHIWRVNPDLHQSEQPDPDPHQSESLQLQRLAVDMEDTGVCKPVVKDSHQYDEKPDPDP
jgi:hypothetical protein